jgi:hypothetical protein
MGIDGGQQQDSFDKAQKGKTDGSRRKGKTSDLPNGTEVKTNSRNGRDQSDDLSPDREDSGESNSQQTTKSNAK